MTNVLAEFSMGADKIWKLLNTQGSISETTLLNMTKLNEETFYGAIGWLARENKIYKGGSIYKLGPTNLSAKIGEDAGKIWTLLSNIKEADIPSIIKLSKIGETDAFAALGWLACEQKIESKNTIVLK